MKKRIRDITDQEFTATRKNLTKGVHGIDLISDDLSSIKVTLTRVMPQGEFSPHKDDYHHVFYFIEGQGIGLLDDEEYIIKPNRIVDIPAGTLHGYRNTSKKNMHLITLNIPAN
jgi:mannose-6-phosphate isomerase-like protein (cupin superfamily)